MMQRYNIVPGIVCLSSKGYWVRWEDVRFLAEDNARLKEENEQFKCKTFLFCDGCKLKKENELLKEENERLLGTINWCCDNCKIKKENEELKKENEELKKENEELKKENEELKEKMKN